jgi:5-methylcytosine-specific restriction endonuclease McrA
MGRRFQRTCPRCRQGRRAVYRVVYDAYLCHTCQVSIEDDGAPVRCEHLKDEPQWALCNGCLRAGPGVDDYDDEWRA